MKIKIFVWLLFIVNIYLLLKIILFKFGDVSIATLYHKFQYIQEHPEVLERSLERKNLDPFATIRMQFGFHRGLNQMVHLYGNIFIFVPTGILLVLLSRFKCITPIFFSFFISLFLECSQLYFAMGYFDVDDLILNTLGGVIGCMMANILRIFVKWVQSGRHSSNRNSTQHTLVELHENY